MEAKKCNYMICKQSSCGVAVISVSLGCVFPNPREECFPMGGQRSSQISRAGTRMFPCGGAAH